MYGWRARIGLLLPAGNTTAEPEFNRMAPEGISIYGARMYAEGATEKSLIAMAENKIRALEELLSAEVDIVAYACTTGSLVKGIGYDVELIKEMESASKIPVITTATAVIEAMKGLQVNRVALATPYIDSLNEIEKRFLENSGIEVTRLKGLGISDRRMNNLTPEVAYRLAKEVNTPEANGIFISCTGFRTIEIIEVLEMDTGKPVITSNQATMWSSLRRLGIKDELRGYGSLFRL